MITSDQLVLHSPRLLMRPFAPADANLIGSVMRNPRIIFWRKGQMSWNLLRTGIRNSQKMNKWGLGWWLIFSKNKNSLIGILLLQPLGNTNDIEIGYHLCREHWGKGYATEAAGRLLEYGFTTLGLRQICAISLPYNHPSIKVIDKLGLIHRKNHLHRGLKHRYFDLKQQDYLRQKHEKDHQRARRART